MEDIKKLTEITEFMTEKMCEFFKEEPRMLSAMVQGYKAQFWFEPSETNKQEMIIKSNIIAPDGGGLTFEEFFKMNLHKK